MRQTAIGQLSTHVFCWLSLLLAGCAIVILFTGCRSDSEDEVQAQSRESVDQATVQALVRSQQALRQGEFRAAMALADSAVASAPRLADAHFQQGRVLSELRRFDRAEEAYREVIALNPEYRGAWLNLGNNAYRQHEYRDALRYYRQEQENHPSAEVFTYMGRSYVALGEVDSAEQTYKQALNVDSAFNEAHARLGQLYEDEGELEEALTHSRQALRSEPDNPKYRYAVGTQLLQLDRPEEAVGYLEDVAEEMPWHQGAHYNLGQALIRLGRQSEGKELISKSDSLRTLESEIENLQARARNNPDDPRAWVELGDRLRQADRFEEAREVFSIAVYLAPQHPGLRNSFALLHAELGNDSAAVAHFNALLQQHPTFADGWFNLGVVYARRGDDERAEEAWERTLQYNPDHPRAASYLTKLRE